MNKKILIALFALYLAGCAPLKSSLIQPAPPGGKAVIFDIDGTLTPRPIEIWSVRPGAVDAVKEYAEKQYKIIYLSARSPMFQSGIPAWLKKNGFPDGYVIVPGSSEESNAPAEFKTKALERLIASDWSIVTAYGDSSTDFEAYSSIGIPKTSVFALKRKGADECQPGVWSECLDGW